jgi:hypothetical protein
MTIDRGTLLFAGALWLAAPALAHTPYRQWKVLRQRFLLVHSTREDPAGDALAERVVAALDRVLPEARAMVARAPDLVRVASLMTTGQAVLAVMREPEAIAMHAADGRFTGLRGEVLRSLLALDQYLLVTVQDLPRHHAWLLASALLETQVALQARVPADNALPVHPGALAFARGEPLEKQE